ncbi:glycosyltransferase [candidate division KSB1 bacterium]|nr:glycosyltransferase [candidate division KSB1 bacterium]
MKVLHIIDSLKLGGKERRFVELFRGFEKHNGHITRNVVILSDDIYFTDIYKFNSKIHFLRRTTKHDPTIFRKLYRLCKILQPEIIHSWESMCSFYAAPIAKILGIPFINGMITIAPEQIKPLSQTWLRAKFTFPLSKIILSNSEEGLKSFNVPKLKGYFIPNGFDFLRLNTLENKEVIRNKFNIKTTHVVGMVAVFSNRKDYASYLKAAMKILRKRADVTFLAVGGGSNLDKYKAIVKSEHKDKIKFLGNQKKVESIINVFDIGVLLTNPGVYGEGISNSILEYMALAKPVIATNGGGTNEIVIDGTTGFLVRPYEIEMLSERVEYLLNNRDVASSMGQAGKGRVINDFSLDRMTNNYLELYKKCVNSTQ